MRHFKTIGGQVPIQTSSRGIKSVRNPSNANFVSVILDEVALEGLDGITLSTLKDRLKQRDNFEIDHLTDDFILEVIKHLVEKGLVEAFQLPSPRLKFDIFDRYKHVDADGIPIGKSS